MNPLFIHCSEEKMIDLGNTNIKDPFNEHLRLRVDWCANDLIYCDESVSSINVGIEESAPFKQFGGNIYIYNSMTHEVVHWIQKASEFAEGGLI